MRIALTLCLLPTILLPAARAVLAAVRFQLYLRPVILIADPTALPNESH